MNDEHSQQRQDDIDEEVKRADERGEVIYIKDMTEEEKEEWENRTLVDNNVVELFDGEDVVAYQIIPEEND